VYLNAEEADGRQQIGAVVTRQTDGDAGNYHVANLTTMTKSAWHHIDFDLVQDTVGDATMKLKIDSVTQPQGGRPCRVQPGPC
jgi:hypothetical protein